MDNLIYGILIGIFVSIPISIVLLLALTRERTVVEQDIYAPYPELKDRNDGA